MPPQLTFNQYGKTDVRLTQVLRTAGEHDLVELVVGILFQGDFARSYTDADNSIVLPTDTIKNTVYAVARQHPISAIEDFARNLASFFLMRFQRLQRIQVTIQQAPWRRISQHVSAYMLAGKEFRFTKLNSTRSTEQITSGIRGLEILKTSDSAFSGFLRDEFTTLAETNDRLLGTVLDAEWTYAGGGGIDFNAEYNRIRLVLLDTFATHASESVQHTSYEMACAALRSSEVLNEVHLVMPNKHRILVDLTKFGLNNPNQLFVPTDQPSGYIEARVAKN